MDRAPDSYRLFSLDPDEVLDAAAELLKGLLPGADVIVLPFDRLSVTAAPGLPGPRAALVDQAVSTMAPALSADGRRLAQPLVTHHVAREHGTLTSKAVGVAIVESAAPLPA
jgi:hypothetical protein